jgi:hypothetical protein
MCPSGVRGVMRDCQRFILACCERSTLALFTPLYGGRLRVGGLLPSVIKPGLLNGSVISQRLASSAQSLLLLHVDCMEKALR